MSGETIEHQYSDEKAFLVGPVLSQEKKAADLYSLKELEALAESYRLDIAGSTVIRVRKPSPATLISPVAIHTLKRAFEEGEIEVCVFDMELKGGQRANLENELEVTVMDRTELILNIFAERAQTSEGKLQVELAKLLYALPRLRGKGNALSALGGGIGTRGPGETKLEIDRRTIRDRVAKLRKKLKKLSGTRGTQRKARLRSGVKTVALVGYTNAGKSTLLNSITGAGAYADNRLFATLDPLTRRFRFDSGLDVVFSDTVGFIRRLPTTLIAAFRSTLEEALYADLLLIVLDASDADVNEHLEVVEQTLTTIGAGEIPRLVVLNKSDLTPGDALPIPGRDHLSISAKKKTGIDELKVKLEKTLDPNQWG